MSRTDYDVIIVGYGPVGAFSALLLARRGLRVAIYELSTKPVVLPRAVALDGESVRAFQRIGLGAEVSDLLQPPRESDELWFTNSRREKLFGMELPRVGANGWRDTAFFDQPELEAFLRARVEAEGGIDVFLGHEVVDIDQAESSATIRARHSTTGETTRASASWVIGCDGASSFVRRNADIAWTSLGYDQDWLVLDVVEKPGSGLPLVTMQVCDPERLTTYVCVKDPNRRWEFQLLEGETREQMLRPERIRSLLAPWVEEDRYEVRRAAVYQFHAATADRWRDGRILLAGDAAHQTPPFLGQGLNAGLRDAVNLGWKIPLVLSGVCDERLIDSYFAERDAHARDLVEWAVAIGKLMETLAAREAGRPDPYPAAEASQTDGYGQGRMAPPMRGGALMNEQASPSLTIGSLLRQPMIRTAEGQQTRFDELLGAGFAVVARSRSALEVGPGALEIVHRLGIRLVGLEGISCTEGELDPILETSPAVLIRPDRYVFGAVDAETSLDELIVELARRISLR